MITHTVTVFAVTKKPLDRVGNDGDDYWEDTAGKKIQEFESFHDKQPCIVTNDRRSVQVWVDGTGQYKGTAALRRVDIKRPSDGEKCQSYRLVSHIEGLDRNP